MCRWECDKGAAVGIEHRTYKAARTEVDKLNDALLPNGTRDARGLTVLCLLPRRQIRHVVSRIRHGKESRRQNLHRQTCSCPECAGVFTRGHVHGTEGSERHGQNLHRLIDCQGLSVSPGAGSSSV